MNMKEFKTTLIVLLIFFILAIVASIIFPILWVTASMTNTNTIMFFSSLIGIIFVSILYISIKRARKTGLSLARMSEEKRIKEFEKAKKQIEQFKKIKKFGFGAFKTERLGLAIIYFIGLVIIGIMWFVKGSLAEIKLIFPTILYFMGVILTLIGYLKKSSGERIMEVMGDHLHPRNKEEELKWKEQIKKINQLPWQKKYEKAIFLFVGNALIISAFGLAILLVS